MSWSELLMSGVTTLVDLSLPSEGWIDRAAESGCGWCLAPMFRNGPWFTKNGYIVEYDLDDAAGARPWMRPLPSSMPPPGTPAGASAAHRPVADRYLQEGLIRDAIAAAAERKMPIQIHAAQSISEFQEIVRRTGLTAVQWLDKLGYLGPRASIGHGIFLDHHPWIRWGTRTDSAGWPRPAPLSPIARPCSRAAA